MKKIPSKFAPLMFALYMALMMGLLMCSVIVAVQSGFGPHYVRNVLKAYAVAVPVAFCCILFVRPIAARLVAKTVHSALG